ncbi:MAG: class I SAM-dependent methyltransferase [Acidobacteria bacterium]|nr:class I SAM-dependent methyltransferase [Acidobacteriota bacterium]MBI3487718.1 class I SAM-dependent methyltransferase [Acidobacteriota bacterium]
MEPAAHQELKVRLAAILAEAAGSAAGTEASAILDAALAVRPEAPAELALELAGKRAAGAPLGLVTGRQRFLGVELLAKDDVLAPREETEILGNEVLSILRARAQEEPARELRMIDMGCGSGNLACAAAVAVPRARIWASDITASCAELTRANAARLSLLDRIEVSQGDLFAPLSGRGLEGTMDLVVMNPPYIPSTSLANSHAALLQHEPREAFDGGPYGISILSRLLQDAPPFLKPGGHLLFEFGLGQARMIQSLVEKKGLYASLRFASDAGGQPRAAIASK